MPFFQDLGKALLWLRLDKQRKQNELARAAGITQAMLCSYEKGKRTPSLDSLGKILSTLGVGLAELEEALLRVREQPVRRFVEEAPARPPAAPAPAGEGAATGADLYALLGRRAGLPAAAEAALGQMLHGFADWLRFVADATPTAPVSSSSSATKTGVREENRRNDSEKRN